MPTGAFVRKDKNEMLRFALQKLQAETNITAIGPGSVARSLAEVLVREVSDFYAALDFNTAMGLISTAQGRALDLIGELYNVRRKELGQIAALDQSVGVFYFYIDQPYGDDIVIPVGTQVYTDDTSFIGDRYSYTTESTVTIYAGRTKAWVKLKPITYDSIYTAGRGTLTKHNFTSPPGTTVRSTNPKPIQAQEGFETDSNYRTRIIKAVRTSAGGTSEAMRFAGLAVNGVRDIRIRSAAYGLGSVEAIIVFEDRGFATSALPAVTEALDKVRPAGVRLIVRQPDYDSVSISGTVMVRKDLNVSRSGVARRAEIGILRYLNTLLPGDTMIYARLLQAALDASDSIQDVSFTKLRVNGAEILRRNYEIEQDRQIVPGDINLIPA